MIYIHRIGITLLFFACAAQAADTGAVRDLVLKKDPFFKLYFTVDFSVPGLPSLISDHVTQADAEANLVSFCQSSAGWRLCKKMEIESIAAHDADTATLVANELLAYGKDYVNTLKKCSKLIAMTRKTARAFSDEKKEAIRQKVFSTSFLEKNNVAALYGIIKAKSFRDAYKAEWLFYKFFPSKHEPIKAASLAAFIGRNYCAQNKNEEALYAHYQSYRLAENPLACMRLVCIHKAREDYESSLYWLEKAKSIVFASEKLYESWAEKQYQSSHLKVTKEQLKSILQFENDGLYDPHIIKHRQQQNDF